MPNYRKRFIKIFVYSFLIVNLFLFCAFITQAENKGDKVDLTKIQYGHWKILDWKGNDRTGATFDAWGGDSFNWVLFYQDESHPILIGDGNRKVDGPDGSKSAWFFNPKLGDKGSCKKGLGKIGVLTKEAKELIDSPQKAGAICGIIEWQGLMGVKDNNNRLMTYDNPEDAYNELKEQPSGIYILIVYGQEGDQKFNPIDEFNNFGESPPITFDLTDPENPKITGPGPKYGEEMTIEGKDKIYNDDECQNREESERPILYVHSGKGGGWEAILKAALKFLLNVAKKLIETLLSWAMKIIETFVIIDTNNFSSQSVLSTWTAIRNFSNILFILLIFAIAVLNLFSDWVDSYTIKKLLPRLLLAIILVNLSLFICRVVVDFANILSSAFLNLNNVDINNFAGEPVKQTLGKTAGGLAGMVVSIIMAAVGFVCSLIAALLIIVRIAVIWFLVIVSPLAFVFWVLPQTQNLFGKWWQEFIKYAFMGPAICLILSIGKMVISTINTGGQDYIVLILSSSTLLISVAVPLMMGGTMMAKVADYGKKAWGYSGAKAVARGKEEFAAQMGEQRGIIGKTLGRLQTERGRARREAQVAEKRAAEYKFWDETKLEERIDKGDQAAITAAIEGGKTHLLEGKNINYSAHNKQLLLEKDPVLAGLQGEALKDHLARADLSKLSSHGLENIIKHGGLENGIADIPDYGLMAMSIRGGKSLQTTLWQGSTSDDYVSMQNDQINKLFQSAMLSQYPEAAAEAIEKMAEAGRLRACLENSNSNQIKSWLSTGTLDHLGARGQQVFQQWYRENQSHLDNMLTSSEIGINPQVFRQRIGL